MTARRFDRSRSTGSTLGAKAPGSFDRFDDALEQPAPVLAAQHCLAETLRVRHHANDVAARVGDARDVGERAVGVGAPHAARPVRIAVAEGDLPFPFQPLQPLRVQGVIAFSTFRCTSRQTYLRESLRRTAPGSIPASSRIWKPLQIPTTCPPRWANLRTSSITGEKRAMAPVRK